MAAASPMRISLPQRPKTLPPSKLRLPLTPPAEDDTKQKPCLATNPEKFVIQQHANAMLTPPAEEDIKLALFPDHGSQQLTSDISSSDPIVAVIGVGFVGEQLVDAVSTSGYHVIAFDISEKRIDGMRATFSRNRLVECTTDACVLSRATHFLITVPTPLNHEQDIDLRYLKAAVSSVSTHARPGSTVVMHSSVPVGMTRQLLGPLMRSKSLKCGASPDRVDPGRPWPKYSKIPKLVSGLDADSLKAIHDLYSEVFHQITPVSSPEVAEMTKLYEDGQRMMCIAYANEMADACRQLSEDLSSITRDGSGDGFSQTMVNIDPFEVARAAATKPFGYQPYTPSLGVGGSGLPVNPHHLLSNADFPLLEACTQRMQERPVEIADRLISSLKRSSKLRKRRRSARSDETSSSSSKQGRRTSEPEQPRVLIVGMGYKRGQATVTHSPSLDLAKHLNKSYDVHVEYADPLVPQESVPDILRLEEEEDWNLSYLRQFDAIIVADDQPKLNLELIDEVQRLGVHVESFSRTKCRWT